MDDIASTSPSSREGSVGSGLEALFAQTAVGVVQADAGLCIARVNRRFAEILGYAADELVGRSIYEITHPDDRPITENSVRRLAAGETSWKAEKRYLKKDGSALKVSVAVSPLRGADGRLQSYLAVMEDITERTRQAELLESEKRILEHIAAGAELGRVLEEIAVLWEHQDTRYPHCLITLTNADGGRLWVAAAPGLPPAFRGLMWGARDSDGSLFAGEGEKLVEDLRADNDYGETELLLTAGLQACWRRPISDRQGRTLGALMVFAPAAALPVAADRILMERVAHLTRIAVEKAQAERELHHLFKSDALTSLPNRALLLDRLEWALTRGEREGHQTALLLLDIDGMRRINEGLGYGFGDAFVQAMATRLRSYLKRDETLARVDGDEFAVAIEGVPGEAALVEIAEALLEHITKPIKVQRQEIFVTASLGISLASGDVKNADTLYRQADTALHRAKARGRNSFQLYRPDMDMPAVDRLKLLGELRRAPERGEFQLYYQPQLDLRTGEVAGAEALIRWRHPRRGLVPPAEFIPLLEETGLILPVGEWIIRQACADLARLGARGLTPPQVAVNLSPRQFHQTALPEKIGAILAETGVAGEQLEVEITESLIMQEPETAAEMLQRLKALRVRVAVDDFGTGYSSLSYLKKFPVDVLKIDKSFMDGVSDLGADAAIAEAVTRMAHSLGMRVVAEGVEQEAQRAFLEAHGCDVLQGYLYSGPLEFEAFAAFLSTSQAAATRVVTTPRLQASRPNN